MNYLGLETHKLEDTVSALNRLLSNYHVYYQNLRNFHWNITGEHFFDLHEKFEELYNAAKINIDAIAERILTLRAKPTSTLKEYLNSSDIKEKITSDPQEMVEHILQNHKLLIQNMRDVLDKAGAMQDEGSVDLVGGFLAEIEKKSWMLGAWVHAQVA